MNWQMGIFQTVFRWEHFLTKQDTDAHEIGYFYSGVRAIPFHPFASTLWVALLLFLSGGELLSILSWFLPPLDLTSCGDTLIIEPDVLVFLWCGVLHSQ